MARTWNLGVGGQCHKCPVAVGQAFCKQHEGEKWNVHGRVDGPIPAKKLCEFLKAAESGNVQPAPASSSQARARPKIGPPAGHPGLKRERPGEEEPAAKAARAAAGMKRKELRCTCHCPIHQEKCPLFRAPSVTTPTPVRVKSAATRSAAPPSAPGRPEFSIISRALSDWARQQVTKTVLEIRSVPQTAQKAAWKRKLLQFHPDKRAAASSASAVAGRSEAQVSEVFLELKRLYDAWFQPNVPGNQVWEPTEEELWRGQQLWAAVNAMRSQVARG